MYSNYNYSIAQPAKLSRAQARVALKNNRFSALLRYVGYSILMSLTMLIPIVGWFILFPMVNYKLCKYFVELNDKEVHAKASLGGIIATILLQILSICWKGTIAMAAGIVMVSIFDDSQAVTIISSLLMLAGFIIMVYDSFRYGMATYILIDRPDSRAIDCVKESNRLMKGNKFRYFCLGLSFIGWSILNSIISCTFAGICLFIIAYMVRDYEFSPDYYGMPFDPNQFGLATIPIFIIMILGVLIIESVLYVYTMASTIAFFRNITGINKVSDSDNNVVIPTEIVPETMNELGATEPETISNEV